MRFDADGSLDTTFSDDGIVQHNYGNVDDEGEDIELTPDGSILVAGMTVTVEYDYSALLMKFTPDGEVDGSFGDAGAVVEDLDDFDYASNLTLQDDGRIVMAGSSGDGPPNGFDLVVWKYMADGTPDISFGNNGFAQHVIPGYYTMIYAMEMQADGKVLIGGQARTTVNDNFFFIARLENDITSGDYARCVRTKRGLGGSQPRHGRLPGDLAVHGAYPGRYADRSARGGRSAGMFLPRPPV